MASLYQRLFNAYRALYFDKFSKQKVLDNVNEMWRAFKKDTSAFPRNAEAKVEELLLEKKTKRKNAYLNFFVVQTSSGKNSTSSKVSSAASSGATSSSESLSHRNSKNLVSESGTKDSAQNSSFAETKNVLKRPYSVMTLEQTEGSSADTSPKTNRQYTKPAQEALKLEISFVEKKLIAEIAKRDAGLGLPGSEKRVSDLKKDLEDKKKLLAAKIGNATRQKKYRDESRETLLLLKRKYPQSTKALNIREKPGRPRLELDQPELKKKC